MWQCGGQLRIWRDGKWGHSLNIILPSQTARAGRALGRTPDSGRVVGAQNWCAEGNGQAAEASSLPSSHIGRIMIDRSRERTGPSHNGIRGEAHAD